MCAAVKLSLCPGQHPLGNHDPHHLQVLQVGRAAAWSWLLLSGHCLPAPACVIFVAQHASIACCTVQLVLLARDPACRSCSLQFSNVAIAPPPSSSSRVGADVAEHLCALFALPADTVRSDSGWLCGTCLWRQLLQPLWRMSTPQCTCRQL